MKDGGLIHPHPRFSYLSGFFFLFDFTMNRFRTLVLLMTLTVIGCSCGKDGENTGDPDGTGMTEFVATGWNGYMVEAMAEAYNDFLETDEMPASINVEGLNYNRGRYLAASCMILKKMVAEPQTWQDQEVDYVIASGPDNDANNTLDVDEMSFGEFMEVIDLTYDYAVGHSIFPNYCTVDSDHKDPDGSEYSTKITINTIYVMCARIFAYYTEHNSLPETISTWDSDFLRETDNCEVSDPLVVSTMQEATAGLTSDYDRAKAIFEYARDEWEWENYNNTSRGAVGTIEDKAGNCCDLTHAIVAMSRAAGIPARYRHAQCQYQSGVIGHVIAEMYVDGVWYLGDASNNENTFGNHEAWSHMATFNGRYKELPF